MIKVMIADDHAIVCAGLKQFLAEDPEIEVVSVASNGEEAVQEVRERELDVVLMDISMPRKTGIDALKQIKALRPELPVLMLSAYPESQYALNLIKAGASGYLNKECDPEDLVTAVHTLARGKRYVSPAIAQKLLEQFGMPLPEHPHELLSPREFQILCKLATGEPLSAIADTLCLSVKTVSTYRSRLFEKMGFNSNADVTAYALKNQLID
ncbi:response regulator transcription factor [Chitinimonas sp.]|uniref:response regulator transcription factor n=1 Tax=Chitinimonas sp. TaxID=1934313 RepID=UPI002F9459B7